MKVVVRHGIFSNSRNMMMLESALRGAYPLIDNRTYTWTDSILVNGVRLASELVAASLVNQNERHVALVGHSMGGLVCRVANCALTDPGFRQHVRAHAKALSPADQNYIDTANLTPGIVTICSMVTLATPNSGAMRKGQLGALALLLNVLKPAPLRSAGIQDLQTDHIFRVLQHCSSNTPCLTMSGSFGNRFGQGATRITYRFLGGWLATVEEPHDLIVEDESVDLSRSILPHELKGPVEHQRAYLNCIDVTHTSIHADPQVHKAVIAFLASTRCGP
jgi:hypothetical protein